MFYMMKSRCLLGEGSQRWGLGASIVDGEGCGWISSWGWGCQISVNGCWFLLEFVLNHDRCCRMLCPRCAFNGSVTRHDWEMWHRARRNTKGSWSWCLLLSDPFLDFSTHSLQPPYRDLMVGDQRQQSKWGKEAVAIHSPWRVVVVGGQRRGQWCYKYEEQIWGGGFYGFF